MLRVVDLEVDSGAGPAAVRRTGSESEYLGAVVIHAASIFEVVVSSCPRQQRPSAAVIRVPVAAIPVPWPVGVVSAILVLLCLLRPSLTILLAPLIALLRLALLALLVLGCSVYAFVGEHGDLKVRCLGHSAFRPHAACGEQAQRQKDD